MVNIGILMVEMWAKSMVKSRGFGADIWFVFGC